MAKRAAVKQYGPFVLSCALSSCFWLFVFGIERSLDCFAVLTGVSSETDDFAKRCFGEETEPDHSNETPVTEAPMAPPPKKRTGPPLAAPSKKASVSAPSAQSTLSSPQGQDKQALSARAPAASTSSLPLSALLSDGKRKVSAGASSSFVSSPPSPPAGWVSSSSSLSGMSSGIWSRASTLEGVLAFAPRLHFLTYGSGANWKGALKRITEQANETGLFGANMHVYSQLPKSVENDPTWAKHLKAKRGGGYWFWKSAMAQQLFVEGTVKDGEWLVYADTGCSLHNQPANYEAWSDLLQFTTEYDIIAFRVDQPEHFWTKGDAFDEFGVSWNSSWGLSKQVCATAFLMACNDRTRKFLDLWVGLAANYHLISDEKSRIKSSPSFKDNRHDQSLWSLLVKANQPKWPNATLPDKKSIFWGKNDAWSKQPAHLKYGIEGLRVLVLRDMTWPVTKGQAISATRQKSYRKR